MQAETFLVHIIDPGLTKLSHIVGDDLTTDEARALLLKIAIQETNLGDRRQISGPARGWWQFEGGQHAATAEVMTNPKTAKAAAALCRREVVPFRLKDVHEALAWNDALAVGFARLLLLTDARPLPAVDDASGSYQYYDSNWRPGKKRPKAWPRSHMRAVDALRNVTASPDAWDDLDAEEADLDDGKDPVAQLGWQRPPVSDSYQDKPGKPTMAASNPQPGVLTVDTGTAEPPVTVELPKLKRGIWTSEFWAVFLPSVLAILSQLAPLIDPALVLIGESNAVMASPIAGAIYAIVRTWYKAKRLKSAADVAADVTLAQPGSTAGPMLSDEIADRIIGELRRQASRRPSV